TGSLRAHAGAVSGFHLEHLRHPGITVDVFHAGRRRRKIPFAALWPGHSADLRRPEDGVAGSLVRRKIPDRNIVAADRFYPRPGGGLILVVAETPGSARDL